MNLFDQPPNFPTSGKSARCRQRYRGKAFFLAGKATSHAYSHMIAVGTLFRSGALKLIETADGTCLEINFNQMIMAYDDLWRKLIAFQAAGDEAGFRQFARELVEGIPDAADQLILQASADMRSYFVERYLG